MGRINVTSTIFEGLSGPNGSLLLISCPRGVGWRNQKLTAANLVETTRGAQANKPTFARMRSGILAEGAIALSVTLSGGALFAS